MAIINEFIAKIEGHGSLTVDWGSNTAKLNIHEGERLFEGILVGRTDEECHWITPRICGVCPIAHNLASLAAIENAYGIKISETSRLVRELMVCGQMIQSHVLHLFFLVLPDYINIDRATELAKKDPESFKKALALKELGDDIAYVAAGRNVHPTKTTIGGFHKIPDVKDLEGLMDKLKETESYARWAADFFAGLKYPQLKVDLELVAQKDGNIVSSRNQTVSMNDYKKNIQEEIRDYSTAKFGKFQNREMLVGSLARLKIYGQKGHDEIDFMNPFHNNLAQAVELELYHERAMEIIDQLMNMELENEIVRPKMDKEEYIGIGGVEAPRGGLYNEIHLDNKGIITYANIITPTVQNLTSIEKSAGALLSQYKDAPQKEKERLLNMLVRAYDPCITCSVH